MKTTLTIEESARLIELGVDPKLASGEVIENISQAEYNEPRPKVFSLTDLLSILPKKVTDRDKIYEPKIWVEHYSEDWCVEYETVHSVSDELDSFVSAPELIDAIFQELCFLKTEKIKEV